MKCCKAPSANDEFITTLLPAMDPSSSQLFICLRSLSPRIDTRACSSSYSIEAESSFSISGHFPTNQIGIGRLIGTQSSQRSYWPTVAACWMDWWTRAQKVADATNISCAPMLTLYNRLLAPYPRGYIYLPIRSFTTVGTRSSHRCGGKVLGLSPSPAIRL